MLPPSVASPINSFNTNATYSDIVSTLLVLHFKVSDLLSIPVAELAKMVEEQQSGKAELLVRLNLLIAAPSGSVRLAHSQEKGWSMQVMP